jgi:hypothetical protein
MLVIKNNQWITAEIVYIRRVYILSKTANSPIIKAYYTQYCKILQKIIRRAKHLYYNKLIKYLEKKYNTMEDNK